MTILSFLVTLSTMSSWRSHPRGYRSYIVGNCEPKLPLKKTVQNLDYNFPSPTKRAIFQWIVHFGRSDYGVLCGLQHKVLNVSGAWSLSLTYWIWDGVSLSVIQGKNKLVLDSGQTWSLTQMLFLSGCKVLGSFFHLSCDLIKWWRKHHYQKWEAVWILVQFYY